jgi:uncharacterized protein
LRVASACAKLRPKELFVMRALLSALFLFCATPAFAQEAPTPTPELIARAEAGDADAAEELGFAYIGQNNLTEAIRWTRRAARAGRPEAMGNLSAYLRDSGQEREADRWERRALEAGSNAARFNMAARTLRDRGATEQQWSRALEALEAADHAETAAVIDSLSQDYDSAEFALPARRRALTQLAADRGAPAAQWRLAMMLREGFGGVRDVPLAYQWARRAAEAGELNSMLSTGVMLAVGEGVARDPYAAAEWYQRAIDTHKSAHALRSLGGMYLSGELEANHARGFAYLMLACRAGDLMAQQLLNRFASLATQETLQAAAEIRDAWMRENGQAR